MYDIVAAAMALLVSALPHALAPPTTPPSLVLASWGGYDNPRQPAEWSCDNPAICLDVMADVHFVHTRTLSGPVLPQSFTASTVFHVSPRRGVRLVLAVRSTLSGKEAIKLGYALAGQTEACFDAGRAEALGVVLPANLTRRGASYCLSPAT